MQTRKDENSPRAYYKLHTKSTQLTITESSSAKVMDIGVTWHQPRAGHKPWARGQSSGCHELSGFSTAKTWMSAGKHRGFGLFLFDSLSLLVIVSFSFAVRFLLLSFDIFG